jgi:hypothetical protein
MMMVESTTDTPRLLHRILCAFLYMGVAPVAFLLRFHHKSDFTSHHMRHALSSSFIMHVVFLIFFILGVLLSFLGIHRADIYYKIRIPIIYWSLFIITFSALLFLTTISLIYAIRGKSTKVLILRRISQKAWLPASMLSIFFASSAFLLLLTFLSCYSLSITPQSNNEAKVYMLYDDADFYPRWVFTLGFLPITVKASNDLGPNSMCVCELTNETFKQAFSKGKFIVVATHGGGPGMIYANRQLYKAKDAYIASDGNRPHFIYLTACSLAKDDDSWNRAFSKTEIVSFNRRSAVLEHIWWLYFEGPDKLKSIFP